jgi:hypothetical protein
LFTLGSGLKITKVAQKFAQLLGGCYVPITVDKKIGKGYILGDLFKNSSGHPVLVAKKRTKKSRTLKKKLFFSFRGKVLPT